MIMIKTNWIAEYLDKNWQVLAATANFMGIPNTELLSQIREGKVSQVNLIWCFTLALIQEGIVNLLWRLYKGF